MNRKEKVMFNEIGELLEGPGEMRCEWRIAGFKCLPEEIDEIILYRSPKFYFSNACWYLALVPSRMMKNHPNRSISVTLFRIDCGPPKTLKISFGLKKSDGTETKWRGEKTFSRESFACDAPGFLNSSAMLNRKSEPAPFDVSTVVCTLESDAYPHTTSSLINRLWNLSVSLKNMLYTPKRTDVVLKMNSHKYPAHRIILESRSDVFKRMFNAGTGEAQTGEVNIEDGNEEAFTIVLSYIYSGVPERLCAQNVREVYKAARKYDLKDLVTLCVEFMEKCSTVDAACDVMELAHSCQDTELKEWAKDYFLKHKTEMFKCAKWRKIETENSALGFEVLKYVFGE